MRRLQVIVLSLLFLPFVFPEYAFADKAAIQLGNDGTTTPYLDATNSYAGTATASAMLFRMNGTEVMRLTATGNVGIGTTSPIWPVQVQSSMTNNAYGILYLQPNLANGSYAQIGVGSAYGTANRLGILSFVPNATLSNSTVRLGLWGSPDTLAVSGNGNVGIGTTAPAKLLQVGNKDGIIQAGTAFGAQISADGGGIGLFGSNLYVDSSGNLKTAGTHATYGYSGMRASWGWLNFYTAFGATTADVTVTPTARMTIDNNGNVGIGTASPGYLLHVNGTAYATGAAGSLSDARHKKDVKTLAFSGLEMISKLRPVSFLWKAPKDDGMKGEQMGFIAQEVEKVLPQVVLTQNNAEKTKGIKYTELIPVLVKGMQELKAEKDALRARLDALEARVK